MHTVQRHIIDRRHFYTTKTLCIWSRAVAILVRCRSLPPKGTRGSVCVLLLLLLWVWYVCMYSTLSSKNCKACKLQTGQKGRWNASRIRLAPLHVITMPFGLGASALVGCCAGSRSTRKVVLFVHTDSYKRIRTQTYALFSNHWTAK